MTSHAAQTAQVADTAAQVPGVSPQGDAAAHGPQGDAAVRPACVACGSQRWTAWCEVRGTAIRQCRTCGLATWDWAAFDFAEFYGRDYWHSTESGKGYADYFSLAEATARTHHARLRWIDRLLVAAGHQPRSRLGQGRTGASTIDESTAAPAEARRLLDAGCGPGFFVRAAAEAGFVACGVEISDYAVEFARQSLMLDVRSGMIRPQDLPNGPFDVVTLWDVIEHVPDPRAALAALADRQQPGGLLLLSTGDVHTWVARLSGPRWHLFNLPEHLWFFSRSSLERLLAQVGYEVVDVRYEWCWYTLQYLTQRLEKVAGLSGRPVSRRLGACSSLALPVTLWDIVSIAARKRTTPLPP